MKFQIFGLVNSPWKFQEILDKNMFEGFFFGITENDFEQHYWTNFEILDVISLCIPRQAYKWKF